MITEFNLIFFFFFRHWHMCYFHSFYHWYPLNCVFDMLAEAFSACLPPFVPYVNIRLFSIRLLEFIFDWWVNFMDILNVSLSCCSHCQGTSIKRWCILQCLSCLKCKLINKQTITNLIHIVYSQGQIFQIVFFFHHLLYE